MVTGDHGAAVEGCEGEPRTFLDQQAPTNRARARWLCTRAWRSWWCVPQPLARALRGRLDEALVSAGAAGPGPLHATHARQTDAHRQHPLLGRERQRKKIDVGSIR